MFKKMSIILCLALLSAVLPAAAQDSIRVTLLTCSPGQEVYSLYGHTAIRCEQPARGIDVAFNYGVFDFKKPHFMWHFVLGQCDYMVQGIPWKYFLEEYSQRGSSVTAQELNLTQAEAERLLSRLVVNCRPENREYRYNFLYNNCTTMVRDIIEQSVEGQVHFPDTLPHYTYRQMLHLYTAQHPWAQEGNDFLLGADVDTILTPRAAMFAPEYLMRYCDKAFVCEDNGDLRPLVRRTEVLIEAKQQPEAEEFPVSPWQAIAIFAAISILIVAAEVLTKRNFWLWDAVLLLVQSAVGLLLTFMALFSEHPGVNSNWLVALFNPTCCIGLFDVLRSAYRRRVSYWHAFHFALLSLFLLFSPWIPQVFGKLIVPLALCLLLRPISYYIYCRRNKKNK